MQSYNDDSIDQLLGAERIRTRPASMLGSSGLAGARHGFTEVYGNALDEKSFEPITISSIPLPW